MANDGSIVIGVDLNDTDFQRTLNGLPRQAQGGLVKTTAVFEFFRQGIDKIFNMIVSSVGSAMNRIDTMDQFSRVMNTMLGSTEKANKALKDTTAIVTGTAFGLDTAAKGVQAFVSSGMEVSKATGALTGSISTGGAAISTSADVIAQHENTGVEVLSEGGLYSEIKKAALESDPTSDAYKLAKNLEGKQPTAYKAGQLYEVLNNESGGRVNQVIAKHYENKATRQANEILQNAGVYTPGQRVYTDLGDKSAIVIKKNGDNYTVMEENGEIKTINKSDIFKSDIVEKSTIQKYIEPTEYARLQIEYQNSHPDAAMNDWFIGRVKDVTGLKVEYVNMDEAQHAAFNPYSNTVYLNRNNKNMSRNEFLTAKTVHEIGHAISKDANYKSIQQTLLNFKYKTQEELQTAIETKKANYAKAGIELENDEMALEELTSTALAECLGTPQTAAQLLNNDAKFGNALLTYIKDALWNFRKMFTMNDKTSEAYKNYKAYRDLEQMYKNVYQAIRNIDQEANAAAAYENVAEVSYSIDETFIKQYEQWDGKERNKVFIVGRTSDALKSIEKIEIKDSIILWDASKIIKTKNDHKEINDNIIKQVPEIIENPIIVMKSRNPKYPTRITMYGDVFTETGKPIFVVLELEPNRNEEYEINQIKVTSTHIRGNTQSIINNSDILYIEPNKERTDNWFMRLGLQLPAGINHYGSIKKITYNDTIDNPQNDENRNLLATHSLNADNLRKTLANGGKMPMTSIAVTKAELTPFDYGDITAVFDVNSIDPAVMAENKIHGKDGWTALHPKEEVKVTQARKNTLYRNIYKPLYEKYGYEMTKALHALANYPQDAINDEKNGLNDIKYKLKRDTNLKRVFLSENGYNATDVITNAEKTKLPDNVIEFGKMLDEIIPKNEYIADENQALKKHYDEIIPIFNKLLDGENVILPMKIIEIQSAYTDYLNSQDGYIISEDKKLAMSDEEVNRLANEKGYEKWIDKITSNLITKTGYRNNVEEITNNGRRSWEVLHTEATPENALNLMLEQDSRRITEFIGTPVDKFILAASKTYNDIDSVKNDRERVKKLNESELKEAQSIIEQKLVKIASSLKGRYVDTNIRINALSEAVYYAENEKGYIRYLKNNYELTLDEYNAKQLAKLKDEAAEFPTEYMEAKPERLLDFFNEVKLLQMPEGKYPDIEAILKENNIPYITYEDGNIEDRTVKLNEGAQNYKFEIDENGNEINPFEAAMNNILKRNGNDTDLREKYLSNTSFADQTRIDIENENLELYDITGKTPEERIKAHNEYLIQNKRGKNADGISHWTYGTDPFDFSALYDKWYRKNTSATFMIDTAQTLKDLGIKENYVVLEAQDILKIKKENKYISDNHIKQIPEYIKNPIVVSQKIEGTTNTISIIGETTSKKGKPLYVMFDLQKDMGLKVYKIKGVQTLAPQKNNPRDIIASGRLNYISENYKTRNAFIKKFKLYNLNKIGKTGIINNLREPVDPLYSEQTTKITPEEGQEAPEITIRDVENDALKQQLIDEDGRQILDYYEKVLMFGETKTKPLFEYYDKYGKREVRLTQNAAANMEKNDNGEVRELLPYVKQIMAQPDEITTGYLEHQYEDYSPKESKRLIFRKKINGSDILLEVSTKHGNNLYITGIQRMTSQMQDYLNPEEKLLNNDYTLENNLFISDFMGELKFNYAGRFLESYLSDRIIESPYTTNSQKQDEFNNINTLNYTDDISEYRNFAYVAGEDNGGQPLKTLSQIDEKYIRNKETSAANADRVIRLWKARKSVYPDAYAADCSGGIIYCLMLAGLVSPSFDTTANGLIGKCKKLSGRKELKVGDWVGQKSGSNVFHIGIVDRVDANGQIWIIEWRGRDRGCVCTTRD